MSSKPNDTLFCWEQIQSVNPLFRLSSLFADKSVAERLTPLYAFFAAIEQLCSSVSDEAVAVRKLGWWREAMLGRDESAGDHPVISELERTGALSLLPQDAVVRLFDMAAYRIEAPSTPGSEELGRVCQMTGEPQLELELAISGSAMVKPLLHRGLAMRRGLLQLIREDLYRERQSWWVPLDFLAKHGLRREDLRKETSADAGQALMGDILKFPLFSEGNHLDENIDISELNQSNRHIFVFDSLTSKKLQNTKNSSYKKHRELVMRPRAGDLFCCWNAARRFNRRK